MKITDVRTAEIKGHGYSTYVRIYTDEGVIGNGECIHGGEGCPAMVQSALPVHHRRGPAECRHALREDAPGQVVRRRNGRCDRDGDDRNRDRALGPGREDHRGPGLPAARRQIPRHGSALLRQSRRSRFLARCLCRARARSRVTRIRCAQVRRR